MNKRYCPARRRLLIATVLVAAVFAALYAVRVPLLDLARTHASLLLSGSRRGFATADSRAAWTAAHPGELRVAFLGDWKSDARRAAFGKSVEAVNAAGGAGGRRLVAEWIDVGASLDVLPDEVMRLACDPSCFAVFVAVPGDALLSVKPILLQGRLLTFAPGVSNVRATRPGEIPYLFLPNPSDAEVAANVADAIRGTEKPGLVVCYDNTEENRGLGEEMQKAFQQRAMPLYIRIPLGKDILKPYVIGMIRQVREFHSIDHVAYLNGGETNECEAVAWLLKNMPGKVVLSRPVAGEWTAAEKARLVLPRRVSAVAAAERSVWLFADAVTRAKTPHPDAVSAVLRREELKTPAGPFRFTPLRFEQKTTSSP